MPLNLKVYPNNEIRIRYSSGIPSQAKDSLEVRSRERSSQRVIDENPKLSQLNPNWKDDNPDYLEILSDSSPKLRSRNKIKACKVAPGWGLLPSERSFSTRGVRKLLRVGGVVDKLFEKEQCCFFTGTLPGSTDEAINTLATWSGYIVNRIGEWVRRHSDNNCYFFVWELQQRGALHIHYCAVFDSPEKAQEMRSNWWEFWAKLMDEVGDRVGVDMWARAEGGTWANNKAVGNFDAQIVKKSVAGYLTRYTVSGCNNLHKLKTKKGRKLKRVSFPSRWWGVSRWLSQKLAEMTHNIELTPGLSSDDKQYQELFDLLPQKIGKLIHQNIITRFYDYPDFIGSGHNWVFYAKDGELEIAFREILTFFPRASAIYPEIHFRRERMKQEAVKRGYDSLSDWANYSQIAKANYIPPTFEKRLQQQKIQLHFARTNCAQWKFSLTIFDLYGVENANAYCQFFLDLLSAGRDELAKEVEAELEQKYSGWQSYVDFESFQANGWFVNPEYVLNLDKKEKVA